MTPPLLPQNLTPLNSLPLNRPFPTPLTLPIPPGQIDSQCPSRHSVPSFYFSHLLLLHNLILPGKASLKPMQTLLKATSKSLKECLCNITKGPRSIFGYMQEIKTRTNQLASLGFPLDSDDIINRSLDQINDPDYKSAISAVQNRENPITFDELYQKLINKELSLNSNLIHSLHPSFLLTMPRKQTTTTVTSLKTLILTSAYYPHPPPTRHLPPLLAHHQPDIFLLSSPTLQRPLSMVPHTWSLSIPIPSLPPSIPLCHLSAPEP